MTISELDKLNAGQRDCLRLVLAHLNSKEIARQLDISPHTVDQRLRTAMRILNAQSRFDAARKFAELDPQNPYQSLIYQSPDVETRLENGKLGTSTGRKGSDSAGKTDSLSNANGAFGTLALEQQGSGRRRLPVPQYRGEKNSLGRLERLGWILAIAIGGALSFGGLLAGLEALSRLHA